MIFDLRPWTNPSETPLETTRRLLRHQTRKLAAAAELLNTYKRLEELSPAESTIPSDPDRSGSAPDDENPLNAFVRSCSVSGTEDSSLEGYDVGLKDSVSLAGIELTCYSTVLSEYVPSTDATRNAVAQGRATITGKLNIEDMAFSGSGELSA